MNDFELTVWNLYVIVTRVWTLRYTNVCFQNPGSQFPVNVNLLMLLLWSCDQIWFETSGRMIDTLIS